MSSIIIYIVGSILWGMAFWGVSWYISLSSLEREEFLQGDSSESDMMGFPHHRFNRSDEE